MKYLVVYDSKTGNTEKIAKEILDAIPEAEKEIKKVSEFTGNEDADVIFVGFWTNRSTCPMSVVNALELMTEKKIALFGTCGMGGSEEYYDSIKKNVEAWLPEACEYLGCYLCQGKMPESVLHKYEQMEGKVPKEQLEAMIQNYHSAKMHPDSKDLMDARKFVKEIVMKY